RVATLGEPQPGVDNAPQQRTVARYPHPLGTSRLTPGSRRHSLARGPLGHLNQHQRPSFLPVQLRPAITAVAPLITGAAVVPAFIMLATFRNVKQHFTTEV